MRRKRTITLTFSAGLLLGLLVVSRLVSVAADSANAPSLVISQLKITSSNGQFITLYNAGPATVDMSKYQLQYFNSYDLSKASSSRLITLSGTVPPHGYFMINDSSLLLCYQVTVDSVSLGLSSTSGLVELMAFNQSSPGTPAIPILQDYVGWSKTTAAGAQTLPSNTNAFLQRIPLDNHHNPVVAVPGAGSWQSVQPDTTNACNLVTDAGSGASVQAGPSQLLPASEPPASIVSLSSETGTTKAATGLPASDIGLKSPSITELLPNPDGTGNDSTDEYIELYNPNPVSFDLSGFVLQAGSKSVRNYTFPASTTLPARSFTAFYSETTNLSLSNTGSQVRLLDPAANSLSVTDTYASAKDGQSWSLAKGKWYWTTSITPNAANVIKQPAISKKTKSSNAKSSKSIAKPKTTSGSSVSLAGGNLDKPSLAPVHTWVLAIVAGAALLYGIYEYRTDLANRVYQFRRYLEARRAGRA